MSDPQKLPVNSEPPIKRKRKKVSMACVFCRRSHMICDENRPCTRCIKREIGHLCHDEKPTKKEEDTNQEPSQLDIQPVPEHLTADLPIAEHSHNAQGSLPQQQEHQQPQPQVSSFLSQHPMFVSEHVGSEFSSLNEFLTMLEDPLLIEPTPSLPLSNSATRSPHITSNSLTTAHDQPTPKENFFLTAADPSTEMTPEDRLKLVINAKLEAGLLQPYNYAQGYARLQNYMDKYMNQSSKQRILKPLSIIRPAFRAIARSLKDVDLVLVEESFERMLLSYDRVFTSMSMPACLWRRTGEIYRGNKEFASLVDCTVDDLRDGKLAIYELMTEESAVNFWEKYGSIAFDKGQKAVLTSCNLRTRDGRKKRPCCFSFTIRRDRYNIPICIVGNFIPIS